MKLFFVQDNQSRERKNKKQINDKRTTIKKRKNSSTESMSTRKIKVLTIVNDSINCNSTYDVVFF